MSDPTLYQNPYFLLALVAFFVNVPLGYVRENCPKFSWKWLFWIHASIPLVVYLRISWGTSKLFIPVIIALAVWSQILGARWRRKAMSQDDIEALQQIPSIEGHTPQNIADQEAMVTLLNMGGPKTNNDVPDFQRRLFCDSKLIRFPMSWAFQKLFATLLIFFRTKATKERYQLIGGGSPIFDSTQAQTSALQEELNRRGRDLKVTFSFNYSSPLPEETIDEIRKNQKNYCLTLSLYPHYSSATTGSNIYYLTETAKTQFPNLRFLNTPSYHLHPQYIKAFVDRINEEVGPGESLDDFYLLFSAHGLPLYFLTEGDPYPFEISQTVANVLAQLKREDCWSLAYQSAVGPLQWIKPATEDMLAALAKRNITKVIVVPISFVTDHIETTCEIDMEYRQIAHDLGIKDFRMSKALECHPGFIQALADTVEKVLPTPTLTRVQGAESNVPHSMNT